MKKLGVLAALVSVSFLAAMGQNQNSVFLMHNQNVVEWTDTAEYDAMVDSIAIPVLKSLVRDSLILGWGFTDHAWGDEWNKNWWMITTSHSAFLTAWSEMISRTNADFPGSLAIFAKLNKRHKDDFYVVRDWNSSGQPSGALMVQQNVVKAGMMGDWNSFMKEKSAPILEELLQEGVLHAYGNLNHAWGSEWNGGFYLAAQNVDGVLAAWRAFTSRMTERHPGWFSEGVKVIDIHKDNIYSIRVQNEVN
ncbi:MAG: hypothetical protein HKN43_00035 [Rhodothermales bacterium]|nr:hypothetical protein [Rhodothermales bacterium]